MSPFQDPNVQHASRKRGLGDKLRADSTVPSRPERGPFRTYPNQAGHAAPSVNLGPGLDVADLESLHGTLGTPALSPTPRIEQPTPIPVRRDRFLLHFPLLKLVEKRVPAGTGVDQIQDLLKAVN